MPHTPGPWIVEDDTIQSSEYIIGELPTIGDGAAPHTEANAHLIAAAPEMLERLQGLCKQVETIMHQIHGLDHTDTHEALVKAYNAITRATGRERG